jgi:hypothetical protein
MAFIDLTTLADVRTWLQATTTTLPHTDDLLLSRLITSASEFIQNWLNRNITSTDYEEVRDGTGGQQFVFANFPVTAVASVIIAGQTIPAVPPPQGLSQGPPAPPTPVTVGWYGGPAGYLFSPTKLVIVGYAVPRWPLCVQLQYTAGYPSVPFDLAQACIEMVANRYRVERDHPGIVSTVMQPATTVSYSQKDMNDNVKSILWKYRAVAPVSSQSRVMAADQTDLASLAAI